MKIKPIKVLLAALSAIILLCACAKGDKASLEPPATVDVTSESMPTGAPTEPTTEPTQPTTEPSSEPTTQPTTEATTQSVTTKPTEKTTVKTTAKTTAKTEKTKSTTTKKPETSQTTTEDVPLPEPEAIAERPEKLSQELRDWVANAQPEEIIEVYLWCESLPDDEIDALVYSEYGFKPEEQDDDNLSVDEPAENDTSPEKRQEEAEYINALIAARRAILKREYTRLNDEFIANYIPKERKVIYAGDYTSTIIVEATTEEILFYSSLPQVLEISSDFGLGDPEPAVEVGEPESSVEEE